MIKCLANLTIKEWISALENQLLNFLSNLGNHLIFLTSKISEACVLTINTLVTIVEKLPRFATQFIKEPYKCIKPYIIGILKGIVKGIVGLVPLIIKTIMRLLVGLVKVLACLATIIIKICMELVIGLFKTLVSLATLVIKIIMWLLAGLLKGINELFQLCLEVARLELVVLRYMQLAPSARIC
ncbi:hypothetical protein QL285_057132 [Trifolium repens]|nr:hypothetical protein QL285_057132 [Trifolium repens]